MPDSQDDAATESKWDEQPTVTDRPNDTPLRGEDSYAVENSTLASRAQARGTKRIAEAENKAVSPDTTTAKRRVRKSTS